MLKTEAPSERHPNLDQYDTTELVTALVDDQHDALQAVHEASEEIATAVMAALPRLVQGGRLIYVGAGTSGRLGLLDSVELFPTFSWPKSRALAVLAGGSRAMFESVEGAEDDAAQGEADLLALAPGANDVVILIAASGTTPFVLGALKAASASGALTIGLANNPGTPLARGAEVAVILNTGAELISGSTRLKAATAQKVALNALSSAIMVRLNKVWGNLMVDLHPTNAKLYRRAVNLTMRATGVDEATARTTLEACRYQVKVAIVALKRNVDPQAAQQRLAAVDGNVGRALGEP